MRRTMSFRGRVYLVFVWLPSIEIFFSPKPDAPVVVAAAASPRLGRRGLMAVAVVAAGAASLGHGAPPAPAGARASSFSPAWHSCVQASKCGPFHDLAVHGPV